MAVNTRRERKPMYKEDLGAPRGRVKAGSFYFEYFHVCVQSGQVILKRDFLACEHDRLAYVRTSWWTWSADDARPRVRAAVSNHDAPNKNWARYLTNDK